MSQRASLLMRRHSSALQAPRDDESVPSRRTDVLEVVVPALVFLLPVVVLPGAQSPTFTGKLAVLLVIAGLGAPRLISLASGRSPLAVPARAAIAFLAVAFASAATSASPLVGFFGLYNWGTGFVFWLACASAWALGTSLGPTGRDRVATAIVAAALVNGAVAVVQVATNLATGPVPMYNATQADGLLGNPIHYEALLAAGLAIACWRGCASRPQWAAVALVLAGQLQLSRERLVLPLIGLILLVVLVRFRSLPALLSAVGSVVGFVLAWRTGGVLSRSGITRAAIASTSPRVLAWKMLLHAVPHHLLLGVGPGETRVASARYESLALARAIAPGAYFTDAHDLPLEILVTTGLLGFAAALVFVVLAGRRSRGVLVLAAVAALVVELVEPLNVAITPLALLAIGAAGPLPPARVCGSPRRVLRAVSVVLLALSVAAAGTLVAGDEEYGSATLHYELSSARAASRLLPMWSAPALAVGRVEALIATNPHLRQQALERERAADLDAVWRDPTDPALRLDLATTDLALGNARAALAAFRTALSVSPWSDAALAGAGLLAGRVGRCAEARADLERAAELVRLDEPLRAALRACSGGRAPAQG